MWLTNSIQVHYRGFTDPKHTNDLRQRIQQATRTHVNHGKDYDKTQNFSTGAWKLKIGVQKNSKAQKTDCKALDLLKGVVNLPLGANKRHLTLALEHAQAHNEENLMLTQLPAYIKQHAIGHNLPDMAATDGKHPDVVARQAFEVVVANAKEASFAAARGGK